MPVVTFAAVPDQRDAQLEKPVPVLNVDDLKPACTDTVKINETVSRPWTMTKGTSPIALHTGIYKLHLEAQATLNNAELNDSVKLPAGVGEDEWIAAQVLGIFEEVEFVVSLLDDLCTETSCPAMSAGKQVAYKWQDDEEYKVPTKMPACKYMNLLISYVKKTLGNEQIVPTDGSPFPKHFKEEMGIILKRLFRVYAHAYLHHFREIRELQAEAHLNFCFKHFMFFVKEFNLVKMEDMAPLAKLMQKFEAQHRCKDRAESGLEAALGM
mmetsp:Transcript_156911/g.273126  ORF Transcript_156911/g.273126 Transcript_156911/m.273126 type:complete len:268 (+) Transcript_156911:96-899(+)